MRTGIVVALLCVSFAAASQVAPTPDQHVGVNPAHRDPHQSKPAPANNSPVCEGTACEEAKRAAAEQKKEREEHVANERAQTDATVGIAWLTFVLAIIAAIQAGLFWRQLSYMREALDDAEDAAAVAREAVETSKRSGAATERQMRAWVGVQGREFFGLNSGHMKVKLDIRNVGLTPAFNMRVTCLVFVRPYPRDRDELFNVHRLDDQSAALLFPQESNWVEAGREEVGTPPELSVAERVAVKDGSKAIYVLGKIEYDTIFESGRTTSFHYVVGGGHGINAGPTEGGYALGVMSYGNDAD